MPPPSPAPPPSVDSLIGRVSGGEDLAQDEMAGLMDAIMQGQCSETQIALLLTALRHKGETVAEVAGAATAMRQHMTPIRTTRTGLIDTCGTGGDGLRTFNISTAAALVTAAAGVPVAKHGNRRVSSRTGSADVLLALGVNIDADVPTVEACLDELGICFCFAPLLHGAMRHVAAVRQKLGVPTIFNLLGPLTNPAGAAYQLVGVGRPELRPLLAETLARLGTTRSLVVCGDDGLDEVTPGGTTQVSEASAGGVREFTWHPSDFGLVPQPLDGMMVDNPEESAALIRRVLAGEPGPARDAVVVNAAAALWTVGKSPELAECVQQVQDAIDTTAASDLLERLAAQSQG